jgi:hypothetical protein
MVIINYVLGYRFDLSDIHIQIYRGTIKIIFIRLSDTYDLCYVHYISKFHVEI